MHKRESQLAYIAALIITSFAIFAFLDSDANFSLANQPNQVGQAISSTSNYPPADFSLLLPANGGSVQSQMPMLSWQTSYGASYYRIEVGTDTAFSDPLVVSAMTTFPETTAFIIPTGRVKPLQSYYWRVTAFNQYGQKLASNGPFVFTVSLDARI